MAMRERLDILIVRRKLAASREKAKTLIRNGCIFVDGRRQDKAGSMFDDTVSIEQKGELFQYVSRGGKKLEKALKEFQISLEGLVCMDVGASTGGFTDCMLQSGAKKVYAIDVGTDQLDQTLRVNPCVVSMEQTNIRFLTPEKVGEWMDFVSLDVAFISLQKVLPSVLNLMKEEAGLVCLIKPQFEAGKGNVGKKGVVRKPSVHQTVIKEVIQFAAKLGFLLVALTYSPIRGPEGNIEYLLYMKKKTKDVFNQENWQEESSQGDETACILARKDVGSIVCQIHSVVTKAHQELKI